jgi:hypothetical protein
VPSSILWFDFSKSADETIATAEFPRRKKMAAPDKRMVIVSDVTIGPPNDRFDSTARPKVSAARLIGRIVFCPPPAIDKIKTRARFRPLV